MLDKAVVECQQDTHAAGCIDWYVVLREESDGLSRPCEAAVHMHQGSLWCRGECGMCEGEAARSATAVEIMMMLFVLCVAAAAG
jgi:hypothetical protein